MADAQTGSKAPRRIRKVETLREQVEKRAVTDAQVKSAGPTRKAARAIGKPVVRPLRWLGHFRVLHIIGLILVPRYFRNSWRELRQVTWPNKKESRRLTLAVMLFALLFGIAIAIVDYGLDKIFKRILLK